MDNKKALKNIGLFIGIPVLLMILLVMMFSKPAEVTHKYSEILYDFEDMKVTGYTLDWGSGDMNITLKDGTQINYVAPNVPQMVEDISPYSKI